MTTYLIRNDGYKYQELGLEIDDIVDFMPEELTYSMIDLLDFSLNNISFKSWWEPGDTKFDPIGGKSSDPVPDVSRWIGATLVLSPRAYSTVVELLNPYGEFLPIQVNNDTFHIFNCLTFGKVDESRSTKTYFKGVVSEIKKIVFDSNEVSDKAAFKTDYNNCIDIYCNDQLKTAIEKSGLTGVIFSDDFAPEF